MVVGGIDAPAHLLSTGVPSLSLTVSRNSLKNHLFVQ